MIFDLDLRCMYLVSTNAIFFYVQRCEYYRRLHVPISDISVVYKSHDIHRGWIPETWRAERWSKRGRAKAKRKTKKETGIGEIAR